MSIDFNNRRFQAVSNSASGEVGGGTVFHYRQAGGIVWGTYEGGAIRFGTLIATVSPDGTLDMRYQHVNDRGEFRSGRCRSTVEVLGDGRYRLNERWTWTEPHDAESGESIVEELPAS